VAFKNTLQKKRVIPDLPGTGVSKYAFFGDKFLIRVFFSNYL
jgi:hypothetical protein